jgi:hypothetical protein
MNLTGLRIVLVAAATVAAIAAAPRAWAEDGESFNQNGQPFRCNFELSCGHGHGHKSGGIGSVACNDGNVVFSPSSLWPPNHKLVTIDVAYLDNDSDADSTGLTINSISSNQDAEDATGSCGPAGPDWIFDSTPVTSTDPSAAATTFQLRSERCGNAGDRIYDVNVTCTDGGSEATQQTVDVFVTVAHSQGHH